MQADMPVCKYYCSLEARLPAACDVVPQSIRSLFRTILLSCSFAGSDFSLLPVAFQSLSDADRNAYEVKVLQGSMDEIRARMSPQNQQMFQNCVEIHMQHIQLGLGQCGSLHPFMIQHV